MEDLCEAAAMDFALLESPQPVPPCPDPAQIDRYGYLLCKNCSEALDLMFSLRLRKTARLMESETFSRRPSTRGKCVGIPNSPNSPAILGAVRARRNCPPNRVDSAPRSIANGAPGCGGRRIPTEGTSARSLPKNLLSTTHRNPQSLGLRFGPQDVHISGREC